MLRHERLNLPLFTEADLLAVDREIEEAAEIARRPAMEDEPLDTLELQIGLEMELESEFGRGRQVFAAGDPSSVTALARADAPRAESRWLAGSGHAASAADSRAFKAAYRAGMAVVPLVAALQVWAVLWLGPSSILSALPGCLLAAWMAPQPRQFVPLPAAITAWCGHVAWTVSLAQAGMLPAAALAAALALSAAAISAADKAACRGRSRPAVRFDVAAAA